MAISAAELALYQNILEDTLLGTDTCTLQSSTWVADDQGGGSYTWRNEATAVPCRLVPRGVITREEMSGGKVVVHDMFEMSVHWDRSLTEEMRIVFEDENYEIIHVDDVHTQRLSRSADVVRVR